MAKWCVLEEKLLLGAHIGSRGLIWEIAIGTKMNDLDYTYSYAVGVKVF